MAADLVWFQTLFPIWHLSSYVLTLTMKNLHTGPQSSFQPKISLVSSSKKVIDHMLYNVCTFYMHEGILHLTDPTKTYKRLQKKGLSMRGEELGTVTGRQVVIMAKERPEWHYVQQTYGCCCCENWRRLFPKTKVRGLLLAFLQRIKPNVSQLQFVPSIQPAKKIYIYYSGFRIYMF